MEGAACGVLEVMVFELAAGTGELEGLLVGEGEPVLGGEHQDSGNASAGRAADRASAGPASGA